MMAHQSVQSVFEETRNTLAMARDGLDDFLHATKASKRIAGLRNAVVWGRAVTNVLQNVRTFKRQEFNRWYEPKQAEMEANPEFKYLKELRNQLLKEGVLGGFSVGTYLHSFNSSQLNQLPRPAGAKGFFMGESKTGGNGWIIELADGTTENYYVDLPTHWNVETKTHFADVIAELGLTPPKRPIDALLPLYFDYLESLVNEAEERFGH